MFNNNYLCQVMLQPNQKLEGQDHADQLSMNRPYEDFEDSYNLNTPQLYPNPEADPAPTCTEPLSNFSDYFSNFFN